MKKKTKIVATVSDMNCSPDFIRALYNAGMNVVRLNTAHQSFDESRKVIENVRAVSDKIAILIDTKGPEIRTLAMEPIELSQSEIVKVSRSAVPGEKHFLTSCDHFIDDVPAGKIILIDDGDIALEVVEKQKDFLVCRTMNPGKIKGKKSINVPGVAISLPALSSKDREYIEFAIDHDIDFIAHSFVRCKEDLLEIQTILNKRNSRIKLIAKIENQQGVDNLDEILNYCYGVMIARGDLAIEMPSEKVPSIQKTIINKCIERRKAVITATQMLHTMIENPRPTRAEISDVANAVYDGTDAVMLSGETAYGKYPLESVQMMTKIIIDVETNVREHRKTKVIPLNTEITAFLCYSAVDAAEKLKADVIVIDTESGRTARALAAYRGITPIFAECYNEYTVRELALSYGIYPRFIDVQKTEHEFIHRSLTQMIEKENITADSRVVILAGNFGPSRGASFIEIGSAAEMMTR